MKNNKSPKIRFQEFTRDWVEEKIGGIVTDVSRKIKMIDDEVYQLVTVRRRNGGIVSRGFYKGFDVLVKSQFIINSGDYLISKRQIVHGANGIVPSYLDGAIVSNEYLVLHGTEKLDIEFFSLISKLPNMYKKFLLSSHGVDIEKLLFDVKDWKKRKIYIPSIPEQKKITSLFESMDKTIDLKEQELAILKQTKQGFLQKMFPNEGESVPKVRFPGFTDAWEQRRLGDVVTIKSGWSPTNFSEGTSMYIKVDDLNYSTREQNDSQMKVQENTRYSKVKTGSTIFPKRGAAIMTNKVRVLAKDSYMDTNMMALEPNSINGEFLYIFICRTGLYKIADTSTIPQINNKHIEPYKVLMPSIEEQVKVGQFFNNFDKLITLHQCELDALKQTKKAFLQKMFV